MYNAVHFGAGSIGRGFLGQLLSEAGCRTIFVDANTELVDALHARGSYPLRLVDADGSAQNLTVGNIDALHVQDGEAVTEAIARAALLSTAVGEGVLPRIAPLLAAGIDRRAAAGAPPLDILLCENGWHVADALRAVMTPLVAPEARDYFHAHVGLVECVVGRMVPAPSDAVRREDSLLVVAEPYTELPVRALALRAPLPPLPGLVLAEDFDAYEARKLFLHNMGHAALAYAGWQAGHAFLWQCVEDARLASLCRAAMGEAQQALVAENGFAPSALSRFTDDLLRRFSSRALGDTVARVASDPMRKLRPHDRLAGAARLCVRHRVGTDALAQVIAFALSYDNAADPAAMRLQSRRVQEGDRVLLTEWCDIAPGSHLSEQVLAALRQSRPVRP